MDQKIKKKTAIIGAGAAGLVAAFYALKGGNSVTIYDKNEFAGKKLRITGNGRLNFTNKDLSPEHYEHYSDRAGADFLDSNALEYDLRMISSILEKNGREEYLEFMDEIGVPVFEKNGYYYPYHERAGEFTDLFVKILKRMGAVFRFNENVKEIKRSDGSESAFEINTVLYDVVILACGGKAAPSTGSEGSGYRLARNFGHTVGFTYPVLVPLNAEPSVLESIAGVRLKALAYGVVDGEIFSSDYGEIQFTDKTISGIPVFQLSRHLTKAVEEKKDVKIRLDLFLNLTNDAEIEEYIRHRKTVLGDLSMEELFEGIFPRKFYDLLLKEFNKTSSDSATDSTVNKEQRFIHFCKTFEINICGHAGYENAQCTRGGVLLSEMKETLESTLVPDLYIIGEMLDVDGDCGGYNLQWAFSCGKLVGEEV